MILGESGMEVRRRFPEVPKHRSRPAAMAMSSPRRRPSPGSPVRGQTGGGSSGSPLCMKQHGRKNLSDRARRRDEGNEPDVTAAVRALERKLLPTRAISLAQAIRDVSWERGFGFASQQPPVA